MGKQPPVLIYEYVEHLAECAGRGRGDEHCSCGAVNRLDDIERAWALLWSVQTSGRAVQNARRLLSEMIDQDGRRRGIGALKPHEMPAGPTAEMMAPDFDAARSEAQPSGSSEVERDMTGETVCGFRVAAWRETHPEHGDKYGWKYSEHWSTPSSRNPAVRVERLFTEAQLRAARSEAQPSGYDGLAERDEMLSWLDVSIVRLNGCHDLGEVNLRNKYIRLRTLLAAPVSAPGMGWIDGRRFSERAGEHWRHVKSGGVYSLPFGRAEAMVQCAEPITDENTLTVYIGEDGMIFARPTHEFHDGRFVIIPTDDQGGEGT